MMKPRLLSHALRTLRRYKLRSAFIMLGSIIGAAALTLVVAVGGAAERKMLTTVRQLFGASSVLIMAGGSQLMSGPRADTARLTLDDVEAVAAEVGEIDVWDPQQTLPATSIRHDGATATARVFGQSERWERVWNRRVVRGESFDASDVRASARVALIGETIARELFAGADPVDAEILIGSVSFRVIGVLEPFGTDVHGMDRDDEIVIPITTMMRRVMNVDTIVSAKLLVRDPSQVDRTVAEVKRILRARHGLTAGQRSDFTMISAVGVQKMVAKTQQILSLYLPLVAGIALLVGAIVAASLMLASVNERVAEIGLRRAVGAQVEDIQLQFLVETAATTFGGGLLGALLGAAISFVAASKLHLGDVVAWRAVLLALVVSAVTGVLAGVVPARRAAKLAPVDALR